jgi:hypothetical protein
MRNALVLVAVSAALATFAVATAGAAQAKTSNSMVAGHTLSVGQQLRSNDGRYALRVRSDGNVILSGPHGAIWSSATRGHAVKLALRTDGNLVVVSGAHVLWSARTSGAGSTVRLAVASTGVVEILDAHGVVWSNKLHNGCTTNRAARAFLVSIHAQSARLCQGNQQILTTHVTTGASALGDGTPTGTWSVSGKVRNTVLHPASGGTYPVHYWMPYNGDYGMHDAPWQTFAYGSPLYKTRGSHGCVHLPGSTMAFLFGWAPIGTRVTVAA